MSEVCAPSYLAGLVASAAALQLHVVHIPGGAAGQLHKGGTGSSPPRVLIDKVCAGTSTITSLAAAVGRACGLGTCLRGRATHVRCASPFRRGPYWIPSAARRFPPPLTARYGLPCSLYLCVLGAAEDTNLDSNISRRCLQQLSIRQNQNACL